MRITGENARRLHLEQHIRLFGGDWFTPLHPNTGCVDLILSNPPYIKTAELENLQPEIFNFEPIRALDGGPDGLSCLRRIIDHAHHYLKPRGSLLLEIGHDQQEDVHQLMKQCGQYDRFSCTQDYRGRDRVAQMRKKMLRMDA